ESGDTIRATSDHPFWTPDGMVPLGTIQAGDRVAVAPFEGVPYEPPSEDTLLTEADLVARWTELGRPSGGQGLEQVLAFLKERDLLPLRYSSPATPYLCKILGSVFGDGNLHFANRTGKGVVTFYGNREDLEAIRADVACLGVTPSK